MRWCSPWLKTKTHCERKEEEKNEQTCEFLCVFLCWFAHFRWVWSVYCWNVMWIFESLSTFDTFYIIVILINGQRLKIASGQFGIWHFSLLSADQSCDTVKHATIKFINYVPVTDRIMMLQFQIGVFNVCDSMQSE